MKVIALFFFVFFCLTNAKLAPLLSASGKNVEEIPGQYIIVYKKETPQGVFQRQLQGTKTAIGVENVGHVYNSVFKGFSSKLTGDQLLEIRKNPFVKYVEIDSVVKISSPQQDSCSQEPSGSWGQTRISQEKINLDGSYTASESGGSGVNAYIVDTGIYTQNTDFQGRASFGFKASPSWSNTDANGHGTHVASTVGGKLYGVAKRVKLIAVKVLGDNGQGSNSGVIAGIDYVASEHVSKGKPSTANLSLGGGKSEALNDALNTAVEMGVAFVVAAGNDDDNACYYSPASATAAITVGATDVGNDPQGSEEDIRSYFSNYGKCVDIFAPGSLIKAAWIGNETATNTISGTSMASPHVCGVVSLLLGDSPSMSPEQVRESLNGNANSKMIDMMCKGRASCDASPNLLVYNGC